MPEPTITVSHSEMERSPVESYGERGFEATRILRCAWADRITLALQLTGIFPDGSGGYTYDLPHKYPHYDGARCVNVTNIVGQDDDRPTAYGGDTKVAGYTYALMTAQYATAQPAASGGGGSAELTDETIEPYAEFLTLSPTGLTWGSSGGDALNKEEAPGKLFRGFNWVFTRMNVSTVPPEYASLVGYVNDAEITSDALGFTFPAETLLYTPPLLQRKVNPDGVSSKWTIQTKFTWKPEGWNKFWRAKTNSWEAIFSGATQVKPYPPGDFTPIVP